MASETGSSDQSPSIEESTTSSNITIPLFLPFILGLNNSTNPPENQPTLGESRDRVVIINPITQRMLIIEGGGGSLRLESLFGDLKSRRRAASKAAIDAMPCVEIEKGDEQCVVCLEEWEAGETVKEMPCKHRFHGNCIENWLRINGTCPVCRYEMPAEEDEESSRKTQEERRENDGERRRGVWVRFSFGGSDQNTAATENQENSDNHQETESWRHFFV